MLDLGYLVGLIEMGREYQLHKRFGLKLADCRARRKAAIMRARAVTAIS